VLSAPLLRYSKCDPRLVFSAFPQGLVHADLFILVNLGEIKASVREKDFVFLYSIPRLIKRMDWPNVVGY
jgi:hypothetical protein